MGVLTTFGTLDVALNGLADYRDNRDLMEAAVLGAMTLGAGFATAGLILRRRWGAVALIMLYGVITALLLSAPGFLSQLHNAAAIIGISSLGPSEHLFANRLVESLFGLIFLFANGLYFKKRWKLMGEPVTSHG